MPIQQQLERNRRRVRLAEILVKSGLDPFKCLDAIEYPTVRQMLYESSGFIEKSYIEIVYDWAGTGQADLDTATEFLGTKFGFGCGAADTEYVSWIGGDNTSVDGFEMVRVRTKAAFDAGLWTTGEVINLYCHWYGPAGGTGSAQIRVSYVELDSQGNEIARTLGFDETTPSLPQESSCSMNAVATVTLNIDGSFTAVML